MGAVFSLAAMQILFAVLLAAASATAAGRRLDVSTSSGGHGPCSASLPDGRSLITGGGEGPLTATQYFGQGGAMLAGDPMIEARSSHICIGLPDNTVLVAGGLGAGNLPLNSAEIFHPDTGRWTLTGAMLAARVGASAVLLADGRALVVGGQIDGQPAATLEIYDPARGRFEPVTGQLSAPRKGPAVAALEDGRVLVAGGTGLGGVVLDTTDIFDPGIDRVLSGPRMLYKRTNFPAVRLLDGKILVAGGSDGSAELASAELFDPEVNEFSPTAPLRTPRQGHLLVVIRNNGRVLAGGGFAGGRPVEQAEYFIPWRGIFEPAASSPAGREGEVVTIGRLSGQGRLTSTRTYVSPSLALTAAGIEGAGWTPGEEVRLYQPGGLETTVAADGKGRIATVLAGPAGYVFARSATSEAGARTGGRTSGKAF